MVEVRGTVHWLTHTDGPARALSVDPAAPGPAAPLLGTTGKVVWVTDGAEGAGADALEVAEIDAELRPRRRPGDPRRRRARQRHAARAVPGRDHGWPSRRTTAGCCSSTSSLARSPSSRPATTATSRTLAWSPDSAWLAWAQPGPQPLSRIRLARVADRFTVDVTDGRFADSDPVFTGDGLYLAFLSRRTFDPVYDAHSFDLSFPFGSRPYLVPLAAQHAVAVRAAAGRPSGRRGGEFKGFFSGTYAGDCRHRSPSRPAWSAVPVDEARYYGLAAVKGGLVWLRSRLSGVLGEGAADLDEDRPRPALERFDLRKRETSTLAGEVDWYAVSGDGSRLVLRRRVGTARSSRATARRTTARRTTR